MLTEEIRKNALRKVKTQTGLTLKDIQKKTREELHVKARKIYAFLCYSEGLTQSEIAKDLGVERSSISTYITSIDLNDLRSNIGNPGHAIDFACWYTGLDRRMITRYYDRYIKEMETKPKDNTKYFLVTYEERRAFGTAKYKTLEKGDSKSDISARYRTRSRVEIKEISKEDYNKHLSEH